jgi:hypothetical protein
MSEHPLLFTTEMVKAILDGRKTQTRRVPIERYRNWKVGDTIWVRETWAQCGTVIAERIAYIAYKADNPLLGATSKIKPCEVPKGKPFLKTIRKYRPSIHMPRWAARIFLEITNIRVERVQDISESDAEAEGTNCDRTYREDFIHLWDSINAKRHGGIYAWYKNPEVKVIEFKRIK